MYITLNLFKAICTGIDKLSFLEVVIACLCIDCVSASVMMTLSDKTALASRWYVWIASLCQLAAFSVMMAALCLISPRYGHHAQESAQCCIRVVWWGIISSCEGSSSGAITYVVFRFLTTSHASILGLRHMRDYDLAKKEQNSYDEKDNFDAEFSRFPATAFSKWLELIPCAFLAVSSIEQTMRRQVTDSGVIGDWGQSAAIITATTGCLHSSYVFCKTIQSAPVSKAGTLTTLHWKPLATLYELRKQLLLRSFETYEVDYTRVKGMPFTPHQTPEDLGTELLQSAKIGDLTGVNQTIQKLRRRNDVTAVWRSQEGMRALPAAANIGNLKVVDALLRAGACPELPDEEPALVAEARKGNVDITRAIVDCDLPGPNKIDRKIILMALSAAGRGGYEEVSMLLLSRTSREEDGRSLVGLAAQTNRTAIVQAYLQSGKLDAECEDDKGACILEHAASIGSDAIVAVLMKHGYSKDRLLSAFLLANAAGYGAVTKLLAKSGKIPDLPEALDREASLPFAIEARASVEVVAKILTHGAALEGRFKSRTSLQIAALRGSHELVTLLIEKGADVNAPASEDGGRTALQAAADGGHTDLVKMLIEEKGADTNAPASEYGGRTALQAAAGGGHTGLVKMLIEEKGADVNAPAGRSGGRTALQAAAGGGHIDLVKMLIEEKGADTNAPAGRSGGRTALQAAADGGHTGLVKMLIEEKGADVNAPASEDGGRTALQAAAEGGHTDLVKMLIEEKGADTNAPAGRNGGRTALQAAAEGGHTDLVNMLIEKGFDVNAPASENIGRSALRAAAEGGQTDLVKMLIEKGVDVKATASEVGGRTALQAAAEGGRTDLVKMLIEKKGADVNAPAGERDGRTALQAAAGGGHTGLVKMLIEKKGADVNAPAGERDGRTALQAAAGGGHTGLVKMLIEEKGADVNAPASEDGGRTALQAAAEGGQIDLVKMLIEKGADVNAPVSVVGGRTVLRAAAEGGHIDLVKMLIEEKGADVNAPAPEVGGRTALQAAAEGGQIDLAKMLIEKGADVNAPVSVVGGRTVLQAAAEGGPIDLVKMLIEKGADVNAPASEYDGRTALQAAAEGAQIDLVKMLIEKGADVNAPASKHGGRTALRVAADGGHTGLVKMLIEKGADVNAPTSERGGRNVLPAIRRRFIAVNLRRRPRVAYKPQP
jgi:ankyrin repeat protein